MQGRRFVALVLLAALVRLGFEASAHLAAIVAGGAGGVLLLQIIAYEIRMRREVPASPAPPPVDEWRDCDATINVGPGLTLRCSCVHTHEGPHATSAIEWPKGVAIRDGGIVQTATGKPSR
jgi:hypothetical protein